VCRWGAAPGSCGTVNVTGTLPWTVATAGEFPRLHELLRRVARIQHVTFRSGRRQSMRSCQRRAVARTTIDPGFEWLCNWFEPTVVVVGIAPWINRA